MSEMARQSGMERHHVRAYLRKYGIDKRLADRAQRERAADFIGIHRVGAFRSVRALQQSAAP